MNSEALAFELWTLEKNEQAKNLWSLEAYQHELAHPDSRHFLLRENGGIEAFILYRVLLDELSILHLAVRHKGRGWGERLLNAFISQLSTQDPAVSDLLLEVSQENKAARELYLKVGFHQIGIRKNYYPDHSDALVMKRSMKG